MFPLCVRCANNKRDYCECEDRSFIGTWTTIEMKEAVSRGYVIEEIYEIYHYDNSRSDLFKPYVDMWLRIKQESSGYPSHVVTEEDKQQYIENYERKEGIELRKEKIEKNEALRFIAKIMLNSFWGKLAQKPNKTRTEIIKSPNKYDEIICDPKKVETGSFMVNENTMICSWKYKDDEMDKITNYNIAVTSYVTAYARLELLKHMEKVESIREGSLLYHDTDSILYKRKLTDPIIECGDYLGELTDEVLKNHSQNAKCRRFTSLGPKNYAYEVIKENGEIVTDIKCKGICLTTNALLKIGFPKMQEMSSEYCKGNVIEEHVQQRQFTISKHSEITTRKFDKLFRPVSNKRCIRGNRTYPYGY
jgi:hypothetical protein